MPGPRRSRSTTSHHPLFQPARPDEFAELIWPPAHGQLERGRSSLVTVDNAHGTGLHAAIARGTGYERYPSAYIKRGHLFVLDFAECTNTSSPPASGLMNPNPRSSSQVTIWPSTRSLIVQSFYEIA